MIGKLLLATGLLLMLATAAAQSRMQRGKLQPMQDAYAAAIRWGDFETAWQLVDPAYKAEHPMTELEFERYQQVQISGYRDLSSSGGPDGTVERAIELRVINKHTMAERWSWACRTSGTGNSRRAPGRPHVRQSPPARRSPTP